MDFPVYARGVTPNGPYKNGPGEIGGVVTVGGIVVHPGDIVVGDADGVIVIRPDEAEELAKKVRAFNDNEAATMERIANEGVLPRPWVDQKLEAIGVEYVD
jgi:regulator of RNase E activity RraA